MTDLSHSGPLAVRQGPSTLPPLLDPRIEQWIRTAPDKLHALMAQHGSPLNIVWPHTVAGNVERMRRVLDGHEVAHEIFYGAKVNKSQALVRAAVAAGVGIDVSSLAEFEDALRAGAGSRPHLCDRTRENSHVPSAARRCGCAHRG